MKISGIAFMICFFSMIATASAQEVTYNALFGNWEYQSPKQNSKLNYDFTLEKKFVCLTEHKKTELKTEGNFTLDKKGDQDRLILTTSVGTLKAKTHTTYHLIKFVGPDTLKAQTVSARQDEWRPETRRNTMIFVRKQEKAKPKD